MPDALIQAIQKRIQKMNTPSGDFTGTLPQAEQDASRQEAMAGYQAVFEAGLAGRERARVLLKILDEMKISADETGS